MMKDNYLKLTKKEKKFFLKNLHGYDTAELFNNLELEDQEELFSLLTFKNKAILISYLSPYQASVLLESLPKNQAINIINYLEPDDLTDILKELDEAVLKEWVTDLDETTKEEFQSLKDYEEDEAGSRMSPNLIKLSPEMEIKEAMQLLIKEAPHVETIQTLFVVDKFNSFLGIVPLKKLIKAKSPLKIEKLYEPSLFVFDYDDLDEVSQLIQEEGIYQMPVLSSHHQLLGMITLDDAIDVYEIEAHEDVRKLSALHEPANVGIFKSSLARLPWLLILLVMTLPIAIIMSRFESIIALYTVLIMFQPLLLDVAGNLGTQSLSTSLIVMNLDLDIKYQHHFKNEILSAALTGIIIGIGGFIISSLFVFINPNLDYNGLVFGLIIGISLFLNLISATLFATLLPKFLDALGIDPANASGPLITTIIDIGSIIVYYSLALFLIEVFL